MSCDEKTPEEVVLQNDLILRQIFKNLTLPDLKVCRQVNILWNVEATKILLKNSDCCPIEITEGEANLIKDYDAIKTDRLDRFLELMKNSYSFQSSSEQDDHDQHVKCQIRRFKFPCNNFFVSQKLLIENWTVEEILKIHGKYFKRLEISLDLTKPAEVDNFSFERLFLEQVPFLQVFAYRCSATMYRYLSLSQDEGSSFLYPEDNEDSKPLPFKPNANVLLNNLKVIELGDESRVSSVFYEVLMAAPNLERIVFRNRCTYDYLKLLLKLKKIHLLKSMDLLYCKSRFPKYELLDELTAAGPQFEEIDIHTFRCYEASSLSEKIVRESIMLRNYIQWLFSSATCLKKIETFYPLGNNQIFREYGLDLPVFPKLKKICLRLIGEPGPVKIFPNYDGLNLSEIFPSLETISFQFIPDSFDDEPSVVFFEEINPISSVRHLHFNYNRVIPPNWLEYLCRMFPNLETIASLKVSNFSGAAEQLWKFRNLKELSITIDMWKNLNSYPAIEAAFTGFTPETCLHLYANDSNKCQSVSEIDTLRVNPSLCDLQNLKKLSILFIGWDRWTIEKCDQCPDNIFLCPNHWEHKKLMMPFPEMPVLLSQVTGRYAFKMCPELEVEITSGCRQIHNGLSGVSPFVTNLVVLEYVEYV